MKILKYYLSLFLFLVTFSIGMGQASVEPSECQAGGPGAVSCETSWSGEGQVGPIGGGGSTSASVSCGAGFHACCNSSVSGSTASCVEN